MNLCDTCARANVSCPIWPNETQSCVEYRKSTQQALNECAQRLGDLHSGKLRPFRRVTSEPGAAHVTIAFGVEPSN